MSAGEQCALNSMTRYNTIGLTMDRKLLIFAGAGASYGVSKDKYPTAVGFRERLAEPIKTEHLYLQLESFLDLNRNGGPVDIEHVLWALDQLLQALDEFIRGDRFGGRLLSQNQIGQVTGNQTSDPHGPTTLSQLNRLAQNATKLKNAINQQIYDLYAKEPTEEELDGSWVPLLKWASGAGFSQIDLVTTNYDLVLEHAMERVGRVLRVDEGWKTRISQTTLDLSRWDSANSADTGLLTKLHGSVDWYRSGTEASPVIRLGHIDFDGDHKKRSIIYPGFKGRPTGVPFIAFHEYFRRCASSATHLLFVGFAFRDEFINDLLATATQPTAQIAVVDPQLPASIPFAQGAVHIQRYFGAPPAPVTVPPHIPLVDEVNDWATGLRKASGST